MQDHLRYLVIDDVPEWAEAIGATTRAYFEKRCGLAKARIHETSAYDPKQADQQISNGGWDLVTLDMNLGEAAAKSRISGLDLLGEIAAGNKAYFVIIVTGAVNDPDLERIYGKETAALLRFGALNEAVRQMPASRVRILHKPEGLAPSAAMEVLRPHLESALDQYRSVSLERNIFRPLPGDPELWEIRFNGGPRITVKHESHFDLIRSALAQPNRALKVIQLVHALAQSSGKSEATLPPTSNVLPHRKSAADLEYRGQQDDDVGGQECLDWSEMAGYSITEMVPVDTPEGTLDLEVLIGALLMVQTRGRALDHAIANFVESYGEAVVISIPGRAAAWAMRGDDARSRFNLDSAPEELAALARTLRPLVAPLRQRWLSGRANAKAEPGLKKGKVRVARGVDTPELALARQHWSRFKKFIGRRPSLSEFHDHMTQWVDRSPTAKGHFHYRPPGGSQLCPFWLTQ